MNDDDVPPSPHPTPGPPSTSPGRFILQHFTPLEFMVPIAPHNQDARQPADMSQFPPSIIVDMFYGCAAVMHWRMPQATDTIESLAGSLYYDEIGSSSSEEAGDEDDDLEAARSPTPVETPQSTRAKEWASRHCDQSERRGINTIDEAMGLITLLWSRSCPKRQEKPPSTEEEDTMRRERVHAWLQTQ